MSRLLGFVAWLALAAPALPGTARAEEEPASSAAEARFDELLTRFDAAFEAATVDSTTDEVLVLEAETIAYVAAELLEEGEPVIAADLLAEALALVDSSFSWPEPSSP